MPLSLLVFAASAAWGRDVPWLSGDLAVTYGRNWGQGLNVAGVAAELELNLLPQLSAGVRAGGALGGGIGVTAQSRSARGYAGLPLMFKLEATPFVSRTRPFVGLGLGVTRAGRWRRSTRTPRRPRAGVSWGRCRR